MVLPIIGSGSVLAADEGAECDLGRQAVRRIAQREFRQYTCQLAEAPGCCKLLDVQEHRKELGILPGGIGHGCDFSVSLSSLKERLAARSLVGLPG